MPKEDLFRPPKSTQTDRGPLKTTQGPRRLTDDPLGPTEGSQTVWVPLYLRPTEPLRTTEGPLMPTKTPQIR